MREVIGRFPDYEQSPSGLEALILHLRKPENGGVAAAAKALGRSRSTVTYWLRKLETFRTFAGQTPEAILDILTETTKHQGIEVAAKLIAVDPKTLQRAIVARQLQLASTG